MSRRHCVFQYWVSRPVLPGAEAGAAAMRDYAMRIGADYVFARHETFTDRLGVDPRWWDKLRPVFDPQFARYDKIAVADVDLWPVDGLAANLFDEPVADFGMVEEIDQPELREKYGRIFTTENDRKWAALCKRVWHSVIPVDAHNRPRVWNAGLVLFSPEGRAKLATHKITPKFYRDTVKREGLPGCFQTEQCYLNMMGFRPDFRFTLLPIHWNRMVHLIQRGSPEVYDKRDAETRMSHIMLPAADHNDAAWHHQKAHEHLHRSATG